ncbi:MAG: hypothetical protein KGJ24_06290 [Burkholderiales bacterium]|nr:hypothetical protein [Burkholderiales bacterium]MDE2565701.1 hypothetical protein [Burkholderiales bacterium]
MDSLSTLQSMGLHLPSPAYLFGAIVFGLVGMVAFRLGRRREQPVTWGLGVALMAYPYVVSNTLVMYLIGAALCAGLYLYRG